MKKAIARKNEETKKSWSKTVERDGMTESIRVEEVENGFVITKEKYGHNKSSKSPDKWISETEKYISNVNPISDEEDEIDKALKVFDKD